MEGRREARKFEPPPWEAEQFEAPKRDRETTDVAQEQPQPDHLTMGQAAAESLVENAKTADLNPTRSGESPHTEAAISAMIAQLAAEEPRTERTFQRVGTAAAAVFAIIGAVIAAWGVVALASSGKAGRVAAVGGTAMLAIGLLFFGAGGWIVVSNLRKRGFI